MAGQHVLHTPNSLSLWLSLSSLPLFHPLNFLSLSPNALNALHGQERRKGGSEEKWERQSNYQEV